MFAVYAKSRFEFSQLEEVFVWGKLVHLPQELVLCGREINQYHNGRVVITQKEYVKGLEVRRIPSSRIREGGSLTPAERTEMRSCIGNGQWLS
eukprot:6265674-Pyramimonas_sp.AAC.1